MRYHGRVGRIIEISIHNRPPSSSRAFVRCELSRGTGKCLLETLRCACLFRHLPIHGKRHTSNPSSLKHRRCASIKYRHFSSPFSGKQASRASLVMGHAQQIFFGFTSAGLLTDAPMGTAKGPGDGTHATGPRERSCE